jgi:hypothetical protein
MASRLALGDYEQLHHAKTLPTDAEADPASADDDGEAVRISTPHSKIGIYIHNIDLDWILIAQVRGF